MPKLVKNCEKFLREVKRLQNLPEVAKRWQKLQKASERRQKNVVKKIPKRCQKMVKLRNWQKIPKVAKKMTKNDKKCQKL